jgi:hypothetical protein
MRILDASRVRSSFAAVIESVRDAQDVVVVVRYGQPVAALMPTHRLPEPDRKTLASLLKSTGRSPPRRQ